MPKLNQRHFLYLILGVCALVGVAVLALRMQDAPAPVPNRVNLALPSQLPAGAVHVALAHGMFEHHGIAAATRTFKTGKQALDTVLSGQADLALVGDTPFVLAALRGEDISIVSTVYSSRKAMALVAWRNRGIVSGADLIGKTIGTVRGTNGQVFLDAMLLAHGLDRGHIKLVELNADSLANALRSGQVDAATLWQPDLARVQAELGPGAVTLFGDDVFVFRFVLVGRRQYIDSEQEAVRRVIAALADATEMIHEQPEATAAVIGRSVGLQGRALDGVFDVTDYRLTLDQSLLLALSAQTRWAYRHGLVRDGVSVPDYLSLLDTRALRAVRPDAIRVIE